MIRLQRLQRRSLQAKMAGGLVLTSLVALVLVAAFMLVFDTHNFRVEMVSDLESLTRMIGENCTAALTFNDDVAAREILRSLMVHPEITSAVVLRLDGSVLARYERGGTDTQGPSFSRTPHDEDAGEHLAATQDVVLHGETQGKVTIRSDLSALHARVRNHAMVWGIVLLAVTGLVSVASRQLHGLILQPLLELAQVAHDIAGKRDYHRRATRHTDDELGYVTDAFNSMLDEIQRRDGDLRRAYKELDRSRIRQVAEEAGERRKAEEALRKSEEQLREAQKMESIGRLAGGVAHDFNNLLTAINGFAQLIQIGLGPKHRLQAKAEQILIAGRRAADLTGQLLAFSRRQMLVPEPLDLGRVITGMREILNSMLGDRVHLRTEFPPGLGTIMADPGQLGQVVMNLVVNARDAMPDGGEILIETKNLRAEECSLDSGLEPSPLGYVMLVIRDRGTGMDEATMAQIFEPFFTTKPRGKGTGLGLSTVYGIVRQSGGDIRVESHPGLGTTFSICFPRIKQAALEETAPPPARIRGRESGTVLLVEDEDLVRALTREIISSEGFDVLEARDGQEAVELARNHPGPIVLMLSDVSMPRMNGPEAAVEVKQLRPSIRMVFMSGFADERALPQIESFPLIPMVHKPFHRDTLLDVIHDVLRREEAA